MLDRPALDAEFVALRQDGVSTSLDQFAIRSIALRHFLPPKALSPLYASPPGKIGSRFASPGGDYACLYVAMDAETAHREGNQAFYAILGRGLAPADLNPPEEVVMIGVHLRLWNLLDLRIAEVQTRLRTSSEELAGRWKNWNLDHIAPTQRLGDALNETRASKGSSIRRSEIPVEPASSSSPIGWRKAPSWTSVLGPSAFRTPSCRWRSPIEDHGKPSDKIHFGEGARHGPH